MSVGKRDYLSRLQTLLVFFNFERHSQNEVGNIGILVLWRGLKKILMACAWLKVDYGKNSFASHTQIVLYNST